MTAAVFLLASVVVGGQVLLIVMEGVTESLLSHVPTPAMDALASEGVLVSLKPEFPSSLLPSLAAMMTGRHSEVTGILDTEVSDGQGGLLSYDRDPEFWRGTHNPTDIKVRSFSSQYSFELIFYRISTRWRDRKPAVSSGQGRWDVTGSGNTETTTL